MAAPAGAEVDSASSPPRRTLEHEGEADAVTFEPRARQLGGALRATLDSIVTTVAGPAPRPTDFAAALGLDKSLASKVVRATRASDPLEALHASPAPQGLRMVVRAAETRGIAPEVCALARDRIVDLQALIDEFAGGRTDFEAALSGMIPEALDVGMRRASHAAYKCMSFVLGYRADVSFSTSFIRPSANGMRCDEAHIGGELGVRRLSYSSPITLFAAGLDSSVAVTPDSLSWECLSGEPVGADFEKVVLRKYSSAELPDLEIVHTRTQRRLRLPADALAINQPVDVVQAMVVRTAQLRYRTPPEHFLASYKMQRPCRVMVMDVFLHDDVCPDARQEVVTRSWTPGPPLPDYDRTDFAIDAVPAPVERAEFPPGLAAIGISDIPGYDEMVDHVLNRLGWDRSRFRGFRLRCQYPLPFVTYGQLFELPEAPDPVSESES